MKDLPKGSGEDDLIEEAAMALLIERDEGFSPERATEFESWRQADPRHAAALKRLEQAWQLLETRGAGCVEKTAATASAGWWRSTAILGMAAAAIAFSIFLWSAGGIGFSETYSTVAGGFQRINLPDGSQLTLNGATTVRVKFGRPERRVTLSTGEAHFAVARDQARPFVVDAAGVAVRAIGTAFNVRLADAAVEVVVSSGKVEIGAPDRQKSPDSGLLAPLLGKGDRVVVGRRIDAVAPEVTRLDEKQLQQALAWHQAMLVFRNTPLREVIQQFNRKNLVQLAIADAEIGERIVGGTFAADNVEVFVSLLERGGDLAVERRGGEIVLRSPR